MAGDGGIGVNSVAPALPSDAHTYIDIGTTYAYKLSTGKIVRFVAAIGDPFENDEPVADLFGQDDDEPAAPPAETMARQRDEPQVTLRKERPKMRPGEPTKEGL